MDESSPGRSADHHPDADDGKGSGGPGWCDRYLLARLVHAEAESEPYSGKVAVAAVILNRIESPKFPNTLAGVVYQPLAFESVANGRIYTNPSSDSIGKPLAMRLTVGTQPAVRCSLESVETGQPVDLVPADHHPYWAACLRSLVLPVTGLPFKSWFKR